MFAGSSGAGGGRAAASGHSSSCTNNSRCLQEVTTRNHFHNSVLLQFVSQHFHRSILARSCNSCSYYTLAEPPVQENKFTRLKEFFCAISTNAFWARQFLFSKHHNFSYICNLPTKAKKLCHFSLKKITKCCIVRFLQLFHFLYILKNIFRNSSSLFFRIFSLHF